jgi:eukaryotic-like serine/threonine-protein kinase
LPTTQLGNYEVRAKIGSGGMGDVFDAVHTGLNKRVAIKTLRKRFLDDEVVVARFLREGQLASRIRHPNIVDVTDVGMMGGLPCLVMEHLEGESFSALIRRDGKLPVTTIVDVLLPVIAAVDFAHDHGIVHRDLKPSNIFLARAWNGELVSKVLDFGISKLVHESAQAALTTDSAFVGTPHYASPELMRADKMADGRSDQYSMGVILYEASTGARPFADLGHNFVALAMAICKGEYPPARNRNPQIPAAFDRVIQRSMALEPQDRFLTMRALGEALLPFASERERLIWGPTFRAPSTGSGSMDVHAPSSGPGSATVMSATVASHPSLKQHATVSSPPSRPSHSSRPSRSGPPTPLSSPSHPFAAGQHHAHSSGPFGATPRISQPPPPQPPYHPSTTPPGAAFDRLPSYGGAGGPISHAPAPSRSGTAVTLIVGLGIGLAILGSVIVLKVGGAAKKDGAGGDTKTLTAAPAQEFTVDLSVVPQNAAIEVDGAPAGAGRLTRSFPRDGKKHSVRLSAAGYETMLLEVDETRPLPPAVALRPHTTTPVASTTPTAAGGQHGSGGKTGGPAGPTGPAPTNTTKKTKTDNIDPWE